MGISYNSNITALKAASALNKASNGLGKSLIGLSSGLRINSASDDPAGAAVAAKLNSNSAAFTKAVGNINDGISTVSMADSAASELNSILIRLKELAEQSANGTYSSSQRVSLDDEADALVDEYNRIIGTTSFNGRTLFANGGTSTAIQAGITSGSESQITVNIGSEIQNDLTLEEVNLLIGTGTFQTGVSHSYMGFFAYGSAIGDLDGDGDLDFASRNNGTSRIYTYLNNGNGTFVQGVSHAVSTGNVWLIDVADVDNNGTEDLIVQADAGFTKFTVHLNNGNGTFQAPITTDFLSPQASRFVDINNDGKIDVVGRQGGFYQNVALGNGDGTFQAPLSTGSGPLGYLQTIADVNGDGKLDVLSTGSGGGGPLHVSLGNGNGTFQDRLSFSLGTTSDGTLAVADFNGDDIADIISGGMQLSLGNGNGTFAAPVTVNSMPTAVIETADLDSDGNYDLIVSSVTTYHTAVLLGNGNGTFTAQVTVSSNWTNPRLFIADMDEDNVVDIFTGGVLEYTWLIRQNSIDSGENTVELSHSGSNASTISYLDLTSASAAETSSELVDQLLDNMSRERGSLAASQSRLNSASTVAQSISTTYAEAADKITSIDMAEELAKRVSYQILQQSAQAIFAQANIQPQRALELLRFSLPTEY